MPCVRLNVPGWDSHIHEFQSLNMPKLSRALVIGMSRKSVVCVCVCV